MGFPGGSDSKESTYNAGDLGSIPGLGRSPGEGKAWKIPDCITHGVAKSQTRLSDFHLLIIVKEIDQIGYHFNVPHNANNSLLIYSGQYMSNKFLP